MQKGLRLIVKRKDAQADVIIYLAKNGPANMYQIGKQTGLYYSSVHKVINTFLLSGLVKPESSSVSKKNVKTTSYCLTFKGVLKYLANFKILPDKGSLKEFATFKIFPDSDFPITEKDSYEMLEKSDKAHKSDLLNVLERQGQMLDYAPFQECRWLSEQYPGLIRLFVFLAQLHLDSSFFNASQFGDIRSKNLSDLEFPVRPIELQTIRDRENLDFMYAFGEAFLQNMFGIKKDSGNEKLRQFAERILNEKKAEIVLLERVASVFSARFPGSVNSVGDDSLC
jgi:hypothetical protein